MRNQPARPIIVSVLCVAVSIGAIAFLTTEPNRDQVRVGRLVLVLTFIVVLKWGYRRTRSN